MNRIHHTNCPVCGATRLKQVLEVKDHSVSGETFPVWECGACSLRFTQDIPDAGSMGRYYSSEDYISHSNTSKGLVNQLYQVVRKSTLKKKRKLIQRSTSLRSGSLLDVGSGTGAFVNEMKQAGWITWGLEPDEGARKLARSLYGIELGNMDQFYRLEQNSFDAITLWHVMEHVHNLPNYVQQLYRLLKPSGKLIIAVPNYTSKDARIYREFWAAYDVPRHLYHFSPAAMQTVLEKNGFVIEKCKPMWYDSFYISMLSSKYRTGKTRLIQSFFNGIRSNLGAVGNVKKCSSVIYIVRRKS